MKIPAVPLMIIEIQNACLELKTVKDENKMSITLRRFQQCPPQRELQLSLLWSRQVHLD